MEETFALKAALFWRLFRVQSGCLLRLAHLGGEFSIGVLATVELDAIFGFSHSTIWLEFSREYFL